MRTRKTCQNKPEDPKRIHRNNNFLCRDHTGTHGRSELFMFVLDLSALSTCLNHEHDDVCTSPSHSKFNLSWLQPRCLRPALVLCRIRELPDDGTSVVFYASSLRYFDRFVTSVRLDVCCPSLLLLYSTWRNFFSTIMLLLLPHASTGCQLPCFTTDGNNTRATLTSAHLNI